MHMQCHAFTMPVLIVRTSPRTSMLTGLLTHYIHHATYLHHIYRILISSELKPTSLAFLSCFLFFFRKQPCTVIMVLLRSGYKDTASQRYSTGKKVDSLKWLWKMEAIEVKKKKKTACGMHSVMSPWNNFSMIKWVAQTIPVWWQHLKKVKKLGAKFFYLHPKRQDCHV